MDVIRLEKMLFYGYHGVADSEKELGGKLTSIDIDYISVPTDPIWAYTIDGNGALTYTTDTGSTVTPTTGYVNFGLHPSCEVDLILGILRYAGVIIKDPSIIQTIGAESAQKVQLENL